MHLKWLPSIERLGESVGHHDECGKVEAETTVTAVDLNVLGERGVVVEAVVPSNDTVGSRVHRGCRDGEFFSHVGRHPHFEVGGVEMAQ